MSSRLAVTPALLAREINGHTGAGCLRKQAFWREGRLFLRRLAHDLELVLDTFATRIIEGGPGDSGAVVLHGETLYVRLYENLGDDAGVCVGFRRCNGRRDYRDETSHFVRMDTLAADPLTLTALVKELRTLASAV